MLKKKKSIFPDLWPSCVPGSRLYFLGQSAQSLLEIDPFKRPSALLTAEAIESIRRGIEPQTHVGIPEEDFISPGSSPPRSINLAQIRYQTLKTTKHRGRAPWKQLESIGARRRTTVTRAMNREETIDGVELFSDRRQGYKDAKTFTSNQQRAF